jgi:hypothetical protein
LLGALGGATTRDSGSVEQPPAGAIQPAPGRDGSAIDAGGLAPAWSPIPAPANRARLSGSPGESAITGAGAAVDGLTVPALIFEPRAEPAPEPGSGTVLQRQAEPEPDPEPATTGAARSEPAAEDGVDQQGRKKRKKDDLLDPGRILKGILK